MKYLLVIGILISIGVGLIFVYADHEEETSSYKDMLLKYYVRETIDTGLKQCNYSESKKSFTMIGKHDHILIDDKYKLFYRGAYYEDFTDTYYQEKYSFPNYQGDSKFTPIVFEKYSNKGYVYMVEHTETFIGLEIRNKNTGERIDARCWY